MSTLKQLKQERRQKEREAHQRTIHEAYEKHYPNGVYRGEEVNMANKASKKNNLPTRKELMAAAKKKGVKNFWPMSKEELVICISSKTSKEKIAAISKKALARSREYLKKKK